MATQNIYQKIKGFIVLCLVYVANADIEVLKKHPYAFRDLVNLAFLMIGMATLVYALQYMALSSYTGSQTFGCIAAGLSAGIIFMLDRIVVGGDYETEGEILYLKEINGDKRQIQQLSLKRKWGMGLRVALGMSIAYAAATLCMPWVLNFEIKGYFNNKEIELNPEAYKQLQATYNEQNRLIRDKRLILDDLEVELADSRSQREVTRHTIFEDIRNLQVKRENSESNALFSNNCANAEYTGVANKECNSTGNIGRGYNYRYWRDQAKLLEIQVKKYSQQIAEKQSQIERSQEVLVQEVVQQRMAKVQLEIYELERALEPKLEEVKKHQILAGIRQRVVRQGPVAMNDAANSVKNNASEYTQNTLFLLKFWVILLELSVFIARFAGCGKDYALAQYKEKLLRNRRVFSSSPLAAVA